MAETKADLPEKIEKFENESRETNAILRDQIKSMQETLAARDRPWYKAPATLIAAIAVMVTTIQTIAGWSMWSRHGDAIEATKKDAEKIRELAQRAIDTQTADAAKARDVAKTQGIKARAANFRSSVLELSDLSTPFVEVREYSVRLSARSRLGSNYGFDPINQPTVRIQFEIAKKLEREVESEVTYAEYLVLANISCAFLGFDEAEAYVHKALERLDNVLNSAHIQWAVSRVVGRD